MVITTLTASPGETRVRGYHYDGWHLFATREAAQAYLDGGEPERERECKRQEHGPEESGGCGRRWPTPTRTAAVPARRSRRPGSGTSGRRQECRDGHDD